MVASWSLSYSDIFGIILVLVGQYQSERSVRGDVLCMGAGADVLMQRSVGHV